MSELIRALKEAADRGWRVYLTCDGPDDVVVWADRGDCNCPHDKPYSKSDGHGYETIDETDLTIASLTDWLMKLEDYKR